LGLREKPLPQKPTGIAVLFKTPGVCRRAAVALGSLLLWSAALGAIPSDEASFTVRDDLGRTVSIPRKVERIISLQPEASRILAALGCADKIVGLDYFLIKNDHLFGLIVPDSKNLPVVAYEDASVNLESVIRLNPDVILASPYDAHVPDSLQMKTGRPVVAISSLGRFQGLFDEIRLIGRVVDRSRRAEELIAYFQRTLDGLIRTLGRVPQAERPRAYLAFWSSVVRTPVSYDPVTIAGGQNLGQSLASMYPGSDGAVVSLERLVSWDPDIILIHGNYPPQERRVTVDGVLADRRLRSVKAVRDKRVYYTFGFWSWWDPAEVLVETLYLAKIFHPVLFGELDLEREANAIYKEFYGLQDGYKILCRTLGCDDWLKK
jgi:iron complex transport system substrate-binding protein